MQRSVLWGPGFSRFNDAAWPTPAHKAKAVDEYKAFGTHLVSDFFDTLPDIETLIPAAACNLRFARGEKDKYNSLDDLRMLAEIHARSQSGFKSVVLELKGLTVHLHPANSTRKNVIYTSTAFLSFNSIVKGGSGADERAMIGLICN